MGYIYLISNDINNKPYIGKTVTTIAERYSKHKYDMFHYEDTCAIHHAMKKYGIEHFNIEEIEKCDNDILSEREKYWIAYYDAYENGYNLTPGGEGCPKYDYKFIYDEFKKGKTQKEIAEELECEKHTITRALRSYDVPVAEMQKGKYGNAKKKIYQIDKQTQQVLKEFSSLTEAAEYEQCSVSMISMVCNKKRNLVNKTYTYTKQLGENLCSNRKKIDAR